MRKMSTVAGSIAAATAGAVVLGGVALADCHHDSHCCDNSGRSSNAGNGSNRGGDGVGGTATNNCLNVGVPILSGLGVGGTGSASGASCDASANGTGGDAF